MTKKELVELMNTSKIIEVLSKRTGALLYQFEKFGSSGWTVSNYNGKLEYESWLYDEQVLRSLLDMRKYCYIGKYI